MRRSGGSYSASQGVGDLPNCNRPRVAVRRERHATEGHGSAEADDTRTQIEPPPYVPTLADLPLPLADAFERAFGPLGVGPSGRPGASDWVALLDRAEADLVRCNQNSSHHHFRQATSCPSCRMEHAFPGFVSFAPTVNPAFADGAPVDLARLIAAVRGVQDPGPAPDLAALMPIQADPNPSQAASEARRSRRGRRIAGALCAAVGLAFFGLTGPGIPLGLIALAVACGLAFGTPASFDAVSQDAKAARAEWEAARRRFEQTAGNGMFLKTRQDAETLIQQVQNLPPEEARRIAALDSVVHGSGVRSH